MASYNLVNGRPNTVDPDLNGIVRSWTDTPLFNVTDAGAPANLTGSEAYFATQPEAAAAIIKAGLDSFTVDDVQRPADDRHAHGRAGPGPADRCTTSTPRSATC